MAYDVVKILGVRVDKITKAQALEEFQKLLEGDRCELIVTPNAEIVEKASKTPELRRIINEEAAIVTPDGVGLIYASKLKGDPIQEKVAGIDFAHSAIELCAKLGRSVYLLGSKPGVAEAAAANLEKEIPGLKIAGFRDGYFREDEEPSVVAEINASGADFLCYVTPAEHLRLPDLNDVKEGIIASRIAAHAADIAKGVPHAREQDNAMAEARHKVDWEEMFKVAVDPEKARAYFESTPPADRHTCSMCGKMCAVRTTNMILEGKTVEFCTEK